MFVKVFSWPLLVTGILSLGFFVFFLFFSRGLEKAGKDTRSFFVFSLVVLTTAVYSLSFFLFVNLNTNVLAINIFNRLAVISGMYIITFFIQFIGVFYRVKAGVSLWIFHGLNIVFTILAIIPNPCFLSAELYSTSIYYQGLGRGILFDVWGGYFLFMMGHASAILWRYYKQARTKGDERSSLALFSTSVIWLVTGVLDALTAMDFIDLPPLSWLGGLLLVFSISRLHMKDIRDLFIRAEGLYDEVIHDKMTGVFSRSFITVEIEKGLDRIKRNLNDQIYLVMIDIDFFKAINDRYGHLCGDKVIKHVAQMAEHAVRTHDFVARMGGDEFLVLIHEPIVLKDMRNLVERIQHLISQTPVIYEGQTIEVNVSIGVSATILPEMRENVNPENMYISADQALYQAKAAGRNRISFSDTLGEIT